MPMKTMFRQEIRSSLSIRARMGYCSTGPTGMISVAPRPSRLAATISTFSISARSSAMDIMSPRIRTLTGVPLPRSAAVTLKYSGNIVRLLGTPLLHHPIPSLRREFVHFAGHEILVLVADPIAVPRDAPDKVQLLGMAEHRVIVQDRDGHRIPFLDRPHKRLGLLVDIDFHRALALEEDIDLLLIGMVVGRPGALVGLEQGVAGDELIGGVTHIEHQEHVLAFEMADAALVLGQFRPLRVKGDRKSTRLNSSHAN